MTGHAELRNFVDGELQGLADRLDHEVAATRIEVTSVRIQLCREEGRHTNARRLTSHHTTGTLRGAGFAVIAAHLHQRLETPAIGEHYGCFGASRRGTSQGREDDRRSRINPYVGSARADSGRSGRRFVQAYGRRRGTDLSPRRCLP